MIGNLLKYGMAAVLICISGCSWIEGSHELSPAELVPPERAALGKGVFLANCQQCHPDGGVGLGPEFGSTLSPGFIRSQVRLGVGRMKFFPEESIPDDHLDALADFILTEPHS